MRHDFCLSVIAGFFQNSLESSLSISLFPVHLQILGVCMAMISKLFSLSNFLICFSRTLTGPLSGTSIMDGHIIFLVVVRGGMGVFVWVFSISVF